MRTLLILVAFIGWGQQGPPAVQPVQPGQPAQPGQPQQAAQPVHPFQVTDTPPGWDQETVELARQLGDWQAQHELVGKVLDNIWERNQWNTEADLAAREAARRISRIPPWQFQARMGELREIVRERYDLDPDQTRNFEQLMGREVWKMGFKYGSLFLSQGKEVLRTRLEGQPFTAEQIARWEAQLDPWIEQIIADTHRITDQLGELLTPQQREIFERDRASLDKRMQTYLNVRELWKQGGWRAEHWGLQDDPLQAAGAAGGQQAGVPLPQFGAWPHDESTWARYVVEFMQRHGLNEDQCRTCNAILEDLRGRARQHVHLHREEIAGIPAAQRPGHALLSPIAAMFEELKQRLDQIPTEQQRRQAQPDSATRRPSALPAHAE